MLPDVRSFTQELKEDECGWPDFGHDAADRPTPSLTDTGRFGVGAVWGNRSRTGEPALVVALGACRVIGLPVLLQEPPWGNDCE